MIPKENDYESIKFGRVAFDFRGRGEDDVFLLGDTLFVGLEDTDNIKLSDFRFCQNKHISVYYDTKEERKRTGFLFNRLAQLPIPPLDFYSIGFDAFYFRNFLTNRSIRINEDQLK